MGTSNINDPRQWLAVDAPVQNKPGYRSAAALRAVVAQFDVEFNTRYRRTPYATFCNIFVTDVTKALNVEIPHWLRDTNVPLGKRELNANGTLEWLMIIGTHNGWREVNATEAERRADDGYPTIAIWKNPNMNKPGHIAILLPSDGQGIQIAQAGAKNFNHGSLAAGFGAVKPIRFFTCD